MTIESIIIIVLLVLILAGVSAVAIVEAQIKQRLNAPQTNGKNGKTELSPEVVDLLKRIDATVSEMLREFKPADGASISYRVNQLVAATLEDAKNYVYNRVAQQEAAAVNKTAVESVGRLNVGVATILEKLDAIAIAQASQGKEQAKIVNNLNSTGRDQVQAERDVNRSDIGASARVGQVAAGTHLDQVTTAAINAAALDTAQQGVDKTQEGVDTIKKGIEQLKDDTK